MARYKQKNANFRREIRQSVLDAKFKMVREDLLRGEHIANVKAVLERLQSDVSEGNIKAAIDMLQMNEDQPMTNMLYESEGIEKELIWLLRHHGHKMTPHVSICLLRTLTFLTFFCEKSLNALTTEHDFIDWLLREVRDMKMGQREEVAYLHQVLRLVINLTSLKGEISLYLAESGVLGIFNEKLAITTTLLGNNSEEYRDDVSLARKDMLKLVKNVVSGVDGRSDLLAALVLGTLKDHTYLKMQPLLSLCLLACAAQRQGLWCHLLRHRESNSLLNEISAVIDTISSRCFEEGFLTNTEDDLSD